MDQVKTGVLIKRLRLQKGLTQAQLADLLLISDRTVSKWERGAGCPDVSLLPALSKALSVDIQGILTGDMAENEEVGGNMKKLQFYVCASCGNIITSTGAARVSCCGRALEPLLFKATDEGHNLEVSMVEDDWFLTSDHAMTKQHALAFIALVQGDRVQLVRLYPEWAASVRFAFSGHGILYFYCNRHGLYRQLI